MSLWANIKFFPEPTGELYGWLLATLVLNLMGIRITLEHCFPREESMKKTRIEPRFFVNDDCSTICFMSFKC